MTTKLIEKVSKKQIAPLLKVLFPEYSGRKFKLVITNQVTFYDLNWSGGTRSTYRAMSLSGNKASQVPEFSPWNNPVEGMTIYLPTFAVVGCHTIACGVDVGVTFFINPGSPDLQKFLPEGK